MKKLLAAKRRSNATAATIAPERDARACKSIVSADLLELPEPQPSSSVLYKLEQKDRGQSREEVAVRRTDDAGKTDSLVVAKQKRATDVSSGKDGVADHCAKVMDEEMMKEVHFCRIKTLRVFFLEGTHAFVRKFAADRFCRRKKHL